MGLFLQCQGQYGTFLYTDPTDSAASSSTTFAIGDGVTTAFTLSRYLGPFLEPVGWVTSLTQVKVAGSVLGSGWSLTTPNTLNFTSAPANGASIGATFAYAFQCRFDADDQDFEQFMQNLWKAELGQVPLGAHVMKATTAAVTNLINAARSSPDAPIAFADCFTFTTTSGTLYTWTNFDLPISYNGYTFLADGPLVAGLKYKGGVGLEVDKQQMTIAARPTDLINGAPFLIALRDGAFDGASVQRDRVFLTAPNGSVVGGVTLFKGRISTVDAVGRTQATVTVASDLVILDYDMPRNLFSPTCVHTLYDSGCGVIRGTYSANGTAGPDSTSSTINSAGCAGAARARVACLHLGRERERAATVKSVGVGGGFNLMYPLPFAPSAGDAFTVYAGCDHTQATCQGRFNNLANFRGFPYVPPPELAL